MRQQCHEEYTKDPRIREVCARVGYQFSLCYPGIYTPETIEISTVPALDWYLNIFDYVCAPHSEKVAV